MNIYLNRITGIDDAIVSMFISTGNWSKELETDIRTLHDRVLDRFGKFKPNANLEDVERFNSYLNKLSKWGWKHITLLRFIDFSITVDGLHRGGQDDWDSHAKRFDNRIIRLSTRVKMMNTKLSDFYQDRVIPTDVALAYLGLDTPDEIMYNGEKYVKCQNGYVLEKYKKNPDSLRGLYMLGLSSTFMFKVNLTEWSHVFKERNEKGHANPEVKECCELIADQIESFQPKINRELFEKIKN